MDVNQPGKRYLLLEFYDMFPKNGARACKTVGYGGMLPKIRTAMRNFADHGGEMVAFASIFQNRNGDSSQRTKRVDIEMRWKKNLSLDWFKEYMYRLKAPYLMVKNPHGFLYVFVPSNLI